jgi:hypothetical protein
VSRTCPAGTPEATSSSSARCYTTAASWSSSYRAWVLIKAFIVADARVPNEVDLPEGPRRLVARELAERREFPVVEVIQWLRGLGQPELLETTARDADIEITRGDDVEVEAVVAPVARSVSE